MKIINFQGGLGNQIFIFMFYLYIKSRYPKEKVYGYYYKKLLNTHYGFELLKLFEVEIPKETWGKNLMSSIILYLNKKGFKNFVSTENDFHESRIFLHGVWIDKRYFLDNLSRLQFKKLKFDETNTSLLEKMYLSESISVHIRRGDFLSANLRWRYIGIATIEYYNSAIEEINRRVSSPKYFIFSDDIEWAKKNLVIPNSIFVDNNLGGNSYLDLYLMAHCKHNIIANSTFSYWAAMLNRNEQKIIIYPAKWENPVTPDIFMPDWLSIDSTGKIVYSDTTKEVIHE